MFYIRNMYNVQLKKLDMKDSINQDALEWVDQKSDEILEYFQRINIDLNRKIGYKLADKFNLDGFTTVED